MTLKTAQLSGIPVEIRPTAWENKNEPQSRNWRSATRALDRHTSLEGSAARG